LQGDEAAERLIRHGMPRGTGVGAAEERRIANDRRLYADVNGFARAAVSGAAFVEEHERRACLGKAGELGPGLRVVRAAPDTVRRGTEVKDTRLVWIDLEAFARGASVFVAAEFDREHGLGPCRAAIDGGKDRRGRSPPLDVLADREVDAFIVNGVQRDAQNALIHEGVVQAADVVIERDPETAHFVPTIGAADVGARIHEIRGGWMINNTAHQAAAADGYGFPRVVFRPCGDGR
jgi:hypothetical protein